MELTYRILSVLHFFISLILIASILLQRTSGAGLFTSSEISTSSFMSSAEIANVFAKISKIFGAFFMINTLFLAVLSMKIGKGKISIGETQIEQSGTIKGISNTVEPVAKSTTKSVTKSAPSPIAKKDTK